jgi:hypothetical protein
MPFLFSIATLLSLLGQGLTFLPPHAWSFTGLVTETRQVELMGFPAEVAHVQSAGFEAWVIQRMDEDRFEVVLGNARPGDQVRVSIQGVHVSKKSVDWGKCRPSDSNYCRLGALYDYGLLALDWNVPLSPSNEFIHLGHPNPSWHQALFWNTERISSAFGCAYRSLPDQSGCRTLCGKFPQSCRQTNARIAVIE